MPAPAYLRKRYQGGTPATTIVGGLTPTDTTITIDDATGWPAEGPGDPFVVALDRAGNEELVLIASRSGTTLTVYADGRGYDNTTAVTHNSGVSIAHVADAGTLDQANRLANLMTAVSQIVGHNGVNPVAVSGSTDGHVLHVDSGEASGLGFERLVAVLVQASAPSVSGNQRLWYDTALDVLRVSNGASWLFDVPLLVFANIAARKAAVSSPVAGQVCVLGGTVLEHYDGSQFRTIGVPEFADDTARDAYYADATVGLYDGAAAKTLDDSAVWEYRDDEWIRRNPKITVSANAPSSPHNGDLWLQPVS